MNLIKYNNKDYLSEKNVLSLEKEFEDSGRIYSLREKMKQKPKLHFDKVSVMHLIKNEDYDNKFITISPER
jgi:hypothetical protein